MLDDASSDLDFVRLPLENCRASNIISELRFVRLTKQLNSSKYGRAAAVSSVASKHTLSELQAMHARAHLGWAKVNRVRQVDAASAPSKDTAGWHAFVATQRRARPSPSMAQISEM